MFVRPCWKPHSENEIYEFIDQNPWGLIVNNGEHGPYATNLPLLLDRSRKGKGVLVGHIARANAHAAVLSSGAAPALAVFQGPYSYVTASWNPKRDMPPTYYYTAVHCYGSLRIQDEHELHRWVEILTEKMESQVKNGWKTTEIEELAFTRRLKAILGFEIEIERMEGKFKLGQDEPEVDALAVAAHLAGRNEGTDTDLGKRICKYSGQRRKSGN